MAERMVIVGGGIAGLTLNRALGDCPYHVELIERDVGKDRHGAGIAVQCGSGCGPFGEGTGRG